MTNLEYISSSPELFMEFIQSIKELQSNPNSKEYSKFTDWLSKWINAVRPEKIHSEQIWLLITVEEDYFSLSSSPHVDLEKKFIWNRFQEERMILVKDENNDETVYVKNLYSYKYRYRFPKEELFKNGIFLGTIKDLPEFNPSIGSFFYDRICNSLEDYGIIGLGQLCNLDYKDDLRDIWGIGQKSLEDIINKLKELAQTEEYSWISNSNLMKTYNVWSYNYWTY